MFFYLQQSTNYLLDSQLRRNFPVASSCSVLYLNLRTVLQIILNILMTSWSPTFQIFVLWKGHFFIIFEKSPVHIFHVELVVCIETAKQYPIESYIQQSFHFNSFKCNWILYLLYVYLTAHGAFIIGCDGEWLCNSSVSFLRAVTSCAWTLVLSSYCSYGKALPLLVLLILKWTSPSSLIFFTFQALTWSPWHSFCHYVIVRLILLL